jgi:hypothetical protein
MRLLASIALLLAAAFLIGNEASEYYTKRRGLVLQTRAESLGIALNLEDYLGEIGPITKLDSSSVVAALAGENVKHKVLVDRGQMRLNKKGELIDAFGSPYEFSHNDDGTIEVKSKRANVDLKVRAYTRPASGSERSETRVSAEFPISTVEAQ